MAGCCSLSVLSLEWDMLTSILGSSFGRCWAGLWGAGAGAGTERAPCTMVDLGILSRLSLGIRNSPGYPTLLQTRIFFLFYNCRRVAKVGEGVRGTLKILCRDLLIAVTTNPWFAGVWVSDLICSPAESASIFLLTSKKLWVRPSHCLAWARPSSKICIADISRQGSKESEHFTEG